MNVKSANYFVSFMAFLLAFSQNAFAMEREILEPKGINIVQKTLVNRELKRRYAPEVNELETSTLPNQTFSEALLNKTNTDPINDWVESKTPTWVENINSFDTKRLQTCFEEYGLYPIAEKMRERAQHIAFQEKEHKNYFSICHGAAPKYGFIYTVQSIFHDFLDIRPSNGVWDFRWDGQGRKANTIQELIEEAQTSTQKDESGVFRDSALCGVPSIYTNFDLTKESCAQLWFTSSSVQNQSVGCVGSHMSLLEKDLKSLGFEKELFFNLRNTLCRDVYETYPENGRLFQIFIHPDAAKELVYLSSSFGRPCTFLKKGQAINDVREVLEAYRNNEEIQATAKVQGKDYSVEMETIQARILFKSEYFSNPKHVIVKDHFIREEEFRPLLIESEKKIEATLEKYLPCWLDTNPQIEKPYPLLILKKYVDEGTGFYTEFYAQQAQK